MGQDKYKAWAEQRERARAGLLIKARNLIAAGDFDAAEKTVRAADDSLETSAALGKVYRECLRTAVAAGVRRETVEAIFRRAKRWVPYTYPEPHTQVEADNYEAGRAEDIATLERIMGHAPAPQPTPVKGGGL
ncbi:MAG TPA: hypothetical protein VEB22_07180 [Phycisphaerales bacterium]|nr:hypothetical protein [Phycisphaerales bacterium]